MKAALLCASSLIGAVAPLGFACAQNGSGKLMAPIVNAVQRKDEVALRRLISGAIELRQGGARQQIMPADIFAKFDGCAPTRVDEARPSPQGQHTHVDDAMATWICGSGCPAPAHTMRAQESDVGYILMVGDFDYRSKACLGKGPFLVAPPSPPPRPQ